MAEYIAIAIVSGILSSFSQVLLKKAAIQNKSGVREYLNPYVIGGYGITFLCMVLMILAYKGLPFKYGAILESLSYFYIMILGKLFFNEALTPKRVLGNLIIVCGAIVFSM